MNQATEDALLARHPHVLRMEDDELIEVIGHGPFLSPGEEVVAAAAVELERRLRRVIRQRTAQPIRTEDGSLVCRQCGKRYKMHCRYGRHMRRVHHVEPATGLPVGVVATT